MCKEIERPRRVIHSAVYEKLEAIFTASGVPALNRGHKGCREDCAARIVLQFVQLSRVVHGFTLSSPVNTCVAITIVWKKNPPQCYRVTNRVDDRYRSMPARA